MGEEISELEKNFKHPRAWELPKKCLVSWGEKKTIFWRSNEMFVLTTARKPDISRHFEAAPTLRLFGTN